MTMAVFDFSAIKARMERRPGTVIVLGDLPKFANIPLSQLSARPVVTTINISVPAITIVEAMKHAGDQLYRCR